jgi:hypothetical protein
MAHRSKPPVDRELKRRVQDLIDYKGGGHNPDLVADIVENALRLLADVEERGDVRVIQTAIRELRYAFKLFAPYHGVRKVTLFGSARTPPTATEYRQAQEFARQIAAAGWMVITGAGPGIMQAGHEGAGPSRSFGANIRLPWEQAANPVIREDKKLITFKYFFTRKLTFVRHADAIALFPGGFGTMDEGYEALTLMQTGKSRIMPLVLIDAPGEAYWRAWDEHIRAYVLRNKFISPDDLHLYDITDSTEEAVRIITGFYRNYHSMRFVKELLVIRLHHAPSAAALKRLNRDFADIVTQPDIHATGPTPEELEDHQEPGRPRIAFGFNRRDYGRLRQLIERLNNL